MGINTGPVSGVADVNDRSNVAGAGINIAQRVMDLGDAGHILLSKRAAEDLSQYRRWEPYLHEIGEVEVKHGVRIAIVNFYTDTIGNPELSSKLRVRKKWTGGSTAHRGGSNGRDDRRGRGYSAMATSFCVEWDAGKKHRCPSI